jgi:hypothetical protein
MKSTILNIPTVRYFTAVVIVLLLPVFYILFNVATLRYIYFPNSHIYAATACLLLLAVSLVLYSRLISIASLAVVLLLGSWTIQNIAFSTYYLWLPSLKTDKWQPLSFGESLREVIFGGEIVGRDALYWLVVLIPLGVCTLLLWMSGKMSNASNQSPNSTPRSGTN